MKSYKRSNNSKIVLPLIFLTGVVLITLVLQNHADAVNANNTVNNNLNTTLLTPNQIAASGPIPPNYTLAQQEQKCIATKQNAPWYPTMNAYERGDGNRTGLYECATFTGSLTGPNSVYAYRSPDRYYTPAIMSTRGINEIYVYGGSQLNTNPMPTSTYVARVEPGTLKELWRTVLLNINISQPWTGVGGMESLAGNLFVVSNTYLYKLIATTGAVEGELTLPTVGSLANNSYFNGMAGWPDGTLVMKNLARAQGCTLQGFNAAVKRTGPASTMVAVDSKTFKVLDYIQLKQPFWISNKLQREIRNS